MSAVVCYWPDGATKCPENAVCYRADRVRHWWIPCCATHAAGAAPADVSDPAAWPLLPLGEP
jgi:hypothetical protein